MSADLGIKAHAHMLRHACGYELANDGHDTRDIQAISVTATFRILRAIPPWRRSGSVNALQNIVTSSLQLRTHRFLPFRMLMGLSFGLFSRTGLELDPTFP
jgi:hypothetical protein